MSFQNVYYQRAVATPRPCAVCLRPTTVVLSTLGNVDFIYTCERHLSDPGFAAKVPDAGASPAAAASPKLPVDEELVKKVKEEWEEKQRRKKEKEEKEKNDKGKGKADEKDSDKDKGKKETEAKPKSPPPPASPPAPAPPTHTKYVLHRQIFASRLLEHRKRRQMKEAREVAPRLPGVPGGALDF